MSNPEPLSWTHPEIAAMWSERNMPLTPDMVSYGSKDRVWWKGKCGHEWKAQVANVTNGSRCPYCASIKVLPGFNDLESRFPKIAAQWSVKNLPLTPDQIMPFSRKMLWWQCEKGHEWQTTANSRAKGNGCPICGNHKIVTGVNDNATSFPELARQWSKKNTRQFNELKRQEFSKAFWWHCEKCGNDYQRTIARKVDAYPDCPYCTGKKAMPGLSDLGTTDPAIASEWDIEKNESWTKADVTRMSKKYIWWRCPVGHSWGCRIRERTVDGMTCKTCAAEFRAVYPQWLIIYLAHREHFFWSYCFLLGHRNTPPSVTMFYFIVCSKGSISKFLRRPFHFDIKMRSLC